MMIVIYSLKVDMHVLKLWYNKQENQPHNIQYTKGTSKLHICIKLCYKEKILFVTLLYSGTQH